MNLRFHNAKERDVIDRAAILDRRSRNDFMILASLKRAKQVISSGAPAVNPPDVEAGASGADPRSESSRPTVS